RLQALGAVAVKNAVYALPMSDQAQEDFEWLLREIFEGGGEAFVCEARLVDGLADQEVRALFNRARDADYEAIVNDVRTLATGLGDGRDPAIRAEAKARLVRHKAHLEQVAAIDFFGADGRHTADELIGELEAKLHEAEPEPASAASLADLREVRGRVW